MKAIIMTAVLLLLSGCANASSDVKKLELSGASLPAVRHMIDMKMSNDTLFFVFDSEEGYGRRFLRRAVVDIDGNTLNMSPDIGKREDGYYAVDMPYPFIDEDGTIHVIGQDDCQIYSAGNDTVLTGTRQYLMDEDIAVPFPLSRYIQDLFVTGPDTYVFIGREPKDGRQFALTANPAASRIDTIRQISISPELQAWMPNMGEMAYSRKYRRLAFAYKLHPIIEIFDFDGNVISSVRIGEDTFDPKTLDEPDFDALNVLHTVDVTYTPDYIYALHWGCGYSDAVNFAPTIYKIDWNGKIIDRYFNVPYPLYRIAAIEDSRLIGWNGKDFILIAI